MSIQSASIALGATYTPAGGVATTFVPTAQAVTNGINVVAAADTSPSTRRSITFKSRNANLDSKTGKFSGKDKRSFVICFPEVLPDGSISFDIARVELEVHPQSVAGKMATMRSYAANVLLDNDCDNFVSVGSLA